MDIKINKYDIVLCSFLHLNVLKYEIYLFNVLRQINTKETLMLSSFT